MTATRAPGPGLRPVLGAAAVGLALIPIGLLFAAGVYRLVDPRNTCELECVIWIPVNYAVWVLICWLLLRLAKVPLASLVTVPVMAAALHFDGDLIYRGAGPLVLPCLAVAVIAAAASAVASWLRGRVRLRSRA